MSLHLATSAPESSLLYGQVLIRLLSHLPPDAVVWRTASGPVNVGQLRVGLFANDPAFLSWVSNSLRVIRDVLATQAEDHLPAESPSDEHRNLAQQASEIPFLSLLEEVPDVATPAFWTPEFGPTSAAELKEALSARAPLSKEYMAYMICAHGRALGA